MREAACSINIKFEILEVRLGCALLGRQRFQVFRCIAFVPLPICPEILEFQILASRFVAICPRSLFVVVIHANIEAHAITIPELIPHLGILKHSLAEADFHLPSTRSRFAKPEDILGLAVLPLHSICPIFARFCIGHVVPSGESPLEINVIVAADSILRRVGIVVESIGQCIDDNFDGVVLPEVAVGIIAVYGVVLGVDSDVEVIVVVSQVVREARIFRAIPRAIVWKIQDPGIVTWSDCRSLESAVFCGRYGTVQFDGAVGNFWTIKHPK